MNVEKMLSPELIIVLDKDYTVDINYNDEQIIKFFRMLVKS